MSRGPALIALALAAGCGVSGREDLVGRYEAVANGRRETWTLLGDGTCHIARESKDGRREATGCEWEWVERGDGAGLAVTLLPAEGSADEARHQMRYVLRPSRFPGRPVTIPLGRGAELRKVE